MALIMVQPNAAFMNFGKKVREFKELNTELSDVELHQRYQFRGDTIDYLCDLVREEVERSTNRNHALSVEKQVLVTLRFLASGSFLQVIGDTVGLDKSTISRTVDRVCDAIVNLRGDFIKWPTTDWRPVIAIFYMFILNHMKTRENLADVNGMVKL